MLLLIQTMIGTMEQFMRANDSPDQFWLGIRFMGKVIDAVRLNIIFCFMDVMPLSDAISF